jgi:hypothetical protein
MTDIKQNTTRNMTPMNEDLAVLRKHFPQCFVKDGDFDFEKFKQQLTTSEVDFYRESIHTLNSNPLIPNFNIVIVDAFAGGGEYLTQDNQRHNGSQKHLLSQY